MSSHQAIIGLIPDIVPAIARVQAFDGETQSIEYPFISSVWEAVLGLPALGFSVLFIAFVGWTFIDSSELAARGGFPFSLFQNSVDSVPGSAGDGGSMTPVPEGGSGQAPYHAAAPVGPVWRGERKGAVNRECIFDPITRRCESQSDELEAGSGKHKDTAPNRTSNSAANNTSAITDPSPEDIPIPFSPAEGLVPKISKENPPSTTPEKKTVRPDNKVGVYLTAGSVARKDFFAKTIESIKAAGGNAIIIDVKGSRVYFNNSAPLAREIGLSAPLYDLPELIKQAHEQGLYVMGRFIAIKDDGLTTKMPETRIRNPKTGKVLSYTWIDPANETAIAYNSQIVCELAAAGIDEVNMDYIRFSTAEVGALRVYSGAEKSDKVEMFIKAMREAIDRCGPDTKLGLSSYAILGWNYEANVETLGQDVVRFAPLVDVISPMAYPATFAVGHYYNPAKHPVSRMYYLVYRTLTGYQELLDSEQSKKLRPWIQGYGVSTKNMQDQIQAVYDADLCGFTVWNANNAYAPAYEAIKRHPIPERCQEGAVFTQNQESGD